MATERAITELKHMPSRKHSKLHIYAGPFKIDYYTNEMLYKSKDKRVK